MSKIDGLVGISMIARLIAGNLLYRRIVTNLAATMLLVVITGMLSGALLLGGCYGTYLALIRRGFEANASAWIVGGVIALAIVLCAFFTLRFVRNLRDALLPVSVAPHIKGIAGAFMDGFNAADRQD